MPSAAVVQPSAPPLPAVPRLSDALWITWENQRRNDGIASALSIPMFVFDFKTSRLVRYLSALWRTIRVVAERRPKYLFVQNPSVVLAFAAVSAGPWLGATVIVDAHNAAIIPLQSSQSGLLRWAARYIVRKARLTLITNDSLARVVESAGGRAFVLPDRIPDLPPLPRAATRLRSSGRNAVFICTFASDEPFLEVIEAARSLDPSITVYVTGNPRHRAAQLNALAPPNVKLTGFIREDDYVALLRTADVIIDLTTREDCLVCGAYEAVAAEQPMILSGTSAIRSYFNRGVRYTDNTATDLAAAIGDAIANGDSMRREARALKADLQVDWSIRHHALVELLTRSQDPPSEKT